LQPIRFVSLLLVIASALTLGLSAGLVAGMTEVHKSPAQPSVYSAEEQKGHVPQPKTVAATSATSASPTTFNTNSTTLPQDLSGADIAQVEGMLETLGYNTQSGLVPAVQKYQEDNALNATGALDINTIQSMVSQLRINRINHLASNTAS